MLKSLVMSEIFITFALPNLNKLKIMNYIRKNEWVSDSKLKIKANNLFVKTLRSLIESEALRRYDGKRITKYFDVAINAILPNGMKVWRNYKDWRGWTDIIFSVKVKGEQDPKYLNYPTAEINFPINQYGIDCPIYLKHGDKFNYARFLQCAKHMIEVVEKDTEETKLCLKNIDRYQKTYMKLEKHINDTLAGIPTMLRASIFFHNPILQD